MALATDYAHRYQYDVFFRTETNIILIQVAFGAFILLLVIAAFSYLYRDVAAQLATSLATILSATTTPPSAEAIVAHLQHIRLRDVLAIGGGVVAATAAVGYLVARMALTPTRNSLDAQKQFIGNIAHELRTPLSIIKTNTEVRLMDPDVPAVGRRIHTQNLEELNRISEIINNLLSMSTFLRPEKIDFENVDLGGVVDRGIKVVGELAQKKSIKIASEKSEHRMVWGNSSALEQIVTNVLRNAIIYTPARGHVRIAIEPDHRGDVELIVEDTGIGIKQKDLTRIFEPFYRSDYSRNRASGGSGLGLTIVSELVKMHHGKISIRSAPGRGTAVTISLPCGHAAYPRKGGGLLTDDPDVGQIEVNFSRRNQGTDRRGA